MKFIFNVSDVNKDGKTDVELSVEVSGAVIFRKTVVDGIHVGVLTNALKFLVNKFGGR